MSLCKNTYKLSDKPFVVPSNDTLQVNGVHLGIQVVNKITLEYILTIA